MCNNLSRLLFNSFLCFENGFNVSIPTILFVLDFHQIHKTPSMISNDTSITVDANCRINVSKFINRLMEIKR